MAVPSKLTAYINNTQYIEIDGLEDGLSDPANPVYFNGATVTATLIDINNLMGQGVKSQVFSISMAYIDTSNGNYRGTLSADAASTLVPGNYTMQIEAVQNGTKLHIEIPTKVAVRKS